jgi:hypothetical protein
MDALKVAATFRVNRLRHAKGQLWQPRYFDRIVRNVRECHKTIEYKGIVETLEVIRCRRTSAMPALCSWSSWNRLG